MTVEFEQFLQTLTPRQQQVTEMALWPRQTWAAIARDLGITTTRVIQITHSVKRKYQVWKTCQAALDTRIELAGELAARKQLLREFSGQ